MAAVMSAKRPRTMTNGLDSIGGVGGSRRNKRPRPSAPDSSEESSIDERSNVSSDSDASDSERDQARDHEQMAWATQQVQQDFQATANKQNVATDSGIIEEIQCINFMCHEHLTVTLGPLINFIIGHNGSGKSAVLTALTICLGGKATATNRAQNLKSLIKEGREHATVTVRIKNQGPLAYKPLQYGGSIIVERHFSKSGTSGFKLKDLNGRVVSTKKAELEDILDAFSMQIDNPMNVLTQDMARQFLNNSTPKDKYKFFLQGTQLENLNRDYQQIEQSLELMNARAEVKEADLGVLRKRMEDLAGKARRAENLERIRAKETEIAHQAAWARVQQEEVELAKAEAEVQRVDLLIEERTRIVNEVSECYERADQAHQTAKENVTEITTELQTAKQHEKDANAQFKESREKILTLKADERTISEDVKAKKKEVNNYESEIEQLRRRQVEADDGVYAEKVRELEEAKGESERAKDLFTNHDSGLPVLQDQMKTTKKEQMIADQKLAKARDDERRIQGNINGLRQGQGNWIDGYPNPGGLDKLLRAIQSDHRFREQPVGPMGRHVKLLRSEWGYILEKQFGQALNGFVVTSKADQAILTGLMRKLNWHSPIYIGNRNPIDTTQNEPGSELLTWMRAVKIEDDLVRNQFIINQGFEQTVLIEDRTEGSRFMHARGPPTRNVKMCFTFADGDKRRGRVINFTSNGGINDSPIDEYRGVLRMQADKEDRIREEQERLEQVQREVHDLKQTCQDVVNRVNACSAQQQNHQKQKKTLQVSFQKAQDKVDRLEGELSEATPDEAAIEVLQDALTKAQEEFERISGVFEDMVLQRDKLNAEARTNKTAMEDAQRAVQGLEFKLEKAHATVRKLQGQREDELKKKNHAIAQVAAAQENRDVWAEHVRTAQSDVDSATKEVESICPQRVAVPHGKTSEQLLETLKKLRATRRETEKELGGSQDELLRLANEAKKTHKNAMQDFEDIKNLRNHLINTLNNRRNRWKQFRSGISVRARVTFSYLLSERKFRGSLMIDHNKGLLDIHVQPDIMERSGDGRQTKTLSGGEKSYSTVCLLLSLWDAMGSPIRCLDEFDVFMDSVNRERSMHMIIQAARRSIGRQFIFITPQSMNNVNQTSDVKIIKMSDPERGQTALNVRRT
ncbi:dna repair protein-like protein rad18 [Cucurbitaria berberidis CBS 394.84]|uniref:Dna repair protein-like protein rad18 n=1 Tax=Cucurbitaria berberidis CBS 394.84 TaxID=1168544 RepID=A0A9P4L6F8_9PLEO|nr:dna repair protein-like protein rad18 [Cucurbitaria berberidis CBS 394.84]KAF1843906.1 dna repair protein-like protein rad18 [Cucurbitaria berberidis CBS 394.84]